MFVILSSLPVFVFSSTIAGKKLSNDRQQKLSNAKKQRCLKLNFKDRIKH